MKPPPALLAEVVRNGFVESRHFGSVSVVAGDGVDLLGVGDVSATMFARSALKPLQLVAMLRAGLDQYRWEPELLALMASSHSGQSVHIAGVQRILARVGLVQTDLSNTPALPMDPAARAALRSTGVTEKAAIYADCSGKHAAMLATCVANDWPTGGYLEPAHPLQQAVRAVVAEFTADDVEHVGVDGCGAALFSCTTRGLAFAYARYATADISSWEGQVAAAMRSHPVMVAGHGRDVTSAMQAVPGLLAKDGAEGVLAAAVISAEHGPLGIAIKIGDGAARPRAVVLAAVLHRLGVLDSPADWAESPVLGGGRVVGHIQSAFR